MKGLYLKYQFHGQQNSQLSTEVGETQDRMMWILRVHKFHGRRLRELTLDSLHYIREAFFENEEK